MDVGAELFEQIGCPIPSIGRFQNDFWMLAGLGHGLGQLERLARYSHTAEHLALGVHPIDRRGAAVQIDSDVLSLHRGLPCRGLVCGNPEHCNARIPRGAEAPLLHNIRTRALSWGIFGVRGRPVSIRVRSAPNGAAQGTGGRLRPRGGAGGPSRD